MSAKKLVKRFLLSPWCAPLRRFYQGKATILVYHRVTEEHLSQDNFCPQSGLSVSLEAFREQMQLLATHFTAVSLEAIIVDDASATGKTSAPQVAVTFDDGYLDNLELALPVLEEFEIPATIFVTSGFIDRTHSPWWLHTGKIIDSVEELTFVWEGKDHHFVTETVSEKNSTFTCLDVMFKKLPLAKQRFLLETIEAASGVRPSFAEEFLTWEQVRTLAEHPLITIGAHTVSHAPLAQCSAVELGEEFGRGRDRLIEELEQNPGFFAYPYGSKQECSLREFDAAELAGYKAAFTTRPGHIQSKHSHSGFALPRLAVDYYMSLEDVRDLVLSGLSVLLKQRGRRFVTD
jgi:peptidoglycan/xylan/chitin deacetylase (PgdA/CDA1 family)